MTSKVVINYCVDFITSLKRDDEELRRRDDDISEELVKLDSQISESSPERHLLLDKEQELLKVMMKERKKMWGQIMDLLNRLSNDKRVSDDHSWFAYDTVKRELEFTSGVDL